MKKTDCPMCTFCQKEDETIEHLFWSCNIAASFVFDVEHEDFFVSIISLQWMIFSLTTVIFYAIHVTFLFFILNTTFLIASAKDCYLVLKTSFISLNLLYKLKSVYTWDVQERQRQWSITMIWGIYLVRLAMNCLCDVLGGQFMIYKKYFLNAFTFISIIKHICFTALLFKTGKVIFNLSWLLFVNDSFITK